MQNHEHIVTQLLALRDLKHRVDAGAMMREVLEQITLPETRVIAPILMRLMHRGGWVHVLTARKLIEFCRPHVATVQMLEDVGSPEAGPIFMTGLAHDLEAALWGD